MALEEVNCDDEICSNDALITPILCSKDMMTLQIESRCYGVFSGGMRRLLGKDA